MKAHTAAICALFLAASGAAGCASAPDGGWITTGDQSRLMQHEPLMMRRAAVQATGQAVLLDPQTPLQTMVGFGAAITDASAHLIQSRMTPAQRDALMRDLFGRADGGLGFDFTRVTIGASDFSLSHYSLADQADPSLAGFSVAPMAAEVFPTVRQALAINPQLKIMATPWSAPGWMKTTGSLIQGELKPQYYSTYAEYLTRYIAEAAAEGVPTHYISIQNEPDFEPDSYPGMRWGPQGRATFIGRDLGPRLERLGLGTKILDWDHNWDKPEQPLGVLADPEARAYVSGVAWHCYAGDVSAQSKVFEAYPDKDVFFTECSGGEWAPAFKDSFVWTMKSLIIGAVENHARGVLMWNIALDENHGPHAGGCGDCRGVVTIDSRTGAVQKNQEYYAFGHASRFVRQGARRVAVAKPEGLEAVGFVNPDGRRVLVVLNPADVEARFDVGEAGRRAQVLLPASSAATYVWSSPR
jgi:glucosylceramidase